MREIYIVCYTHIFSVQWSLSKSILVSEHLDWNAIWEAKCKAFHNLNWQEEVCDWDDICVTRNIKSLYMYSKQY
jgi:hypothetical protein